MQERIFVSEDRSRLRAIGFISTLISLALLAGLLIVGVTLSKGPLGHHQDKPSSAWGVSSGNTTSFKDYDALAVEVDGKNIAVPVTAGKPVPPRGTEIPLWFREGIHHSFATPPAIVAGPDGPVTYYQRYPGLEPRGDYIGYALLGAFAAWLLGAALWVSLSLMLIGFDSGVASAAGDCNWEWARPSEQFDSNLSYWLFFVSGALAVLTAGAVSGLIFGFWVAPVGGHITSAMAVALIAGVAVSAGVLFGLICVWATCARVFSCRILWGPRKRTRLRNVYRYDRWLESNDWHARWLRKRGVELDVYKALGDEYPGTLGELVVCPKELGSS